MGGRLRYGAFVQPGMVTTQRGEGHQFGMYAFSQGGVQALLRYSSAERLRFVCAPPALDAVRGEVQRVWDAARSRLVPASVEDLGGFLQGGSGDTNAWLDLGGDTSRPHRFRRRVGGTYPIGVVQHSVSYGYALHSWFLHLLLGDVRECDSVLCTSTAARDSIRRILDHVAGDLNSEHGTRLAYRGRLDVVPCGVDVDHFRPVPRPEARRPFHIASGETVLLWAGRVSAQDKADLVPFLRVFRDLCQRHPNLRLVLAGAARGDEMQVIGRVATDLGVMDRLSALGLVPRDRLPELYSAADVFVSPVDSLPETFGLTAVEAMACGVPVVASDWDGYRDTVVHGETGFLADVAVGDLSLADDLSEWSLPQGELLDSYVAAQATVVSMRGSGERSVQGVIDCLVGDPGLRSRMGEAGRRRVLERYAWPVVVRRYDDLFEEMSGISATPRPGRPYTRTRFAEAFAGYPTRWLVDGTMVRVVPGMPAPKNPRSHLGVVSAGVAREILGVAWELSCPTVSGIVARMPSLPAAQVRFHIAWLLKQGYLEEVQ